MRMDFRVHRPVPCGLLVHSALALIIGTTSVSAQVRVNLAPGNRPSVQAVSAKEGGKDSSFAKEPIRGPVLGYTFDRRTKALSPIFGVPGASYVGEPLDLGFQLATAEISPFQNYVLGVEVTSEAVWLIDVRGDFAVARPLSGVAAGVDRIVLSPNGDAAGLYDRQVRQVQILIGLPDRLSLQKKIDLSTLPGVLTALAISDDGGTLLAAVSAGDTGSVFALGPQQQPRLITAVGRVLAMTFLNHAPDALIADYDRNEIALIQEVNGAARWILLASESDGIVRPIAVAASADDRRTFAASAAEQVVAAIPTEGGVATSMTCHCTPTGLYRLNGDSIFRMTEASDAPLFLLDAGQGDLRIVFVPPNESSPAPDTVSRLPPRARSRP